MTLLSRSRRRADCSNQIVISRFLDLGRVQFGSVRLKRPSGHQLPVIGAPPSLWIGDDAVSHHQFVRGRQGVELLKCQREQLLTRFGGGDANGDAAGFQRAAASRAAFVRAAGGIDALEANPLQRDVELIGGDLRQRRRMPCPSSTLPLYTVTVRSSR